MTHEYVPINKVGRDFVVGDIHGHFDLLMEELSYEGFDETKDRVFSVGDLIDRGPKSYDCLKLLDLNWFYAVRGNHEQMMIDWAANDGFESWRRNYGTWLDNLSTSEVSIWVERLQNLPISMTVESEGSCVGICHAEPCGFDWSSMVLNSDCYQQMMWGRNVLRGEVDSRPVQGVDITVHGHTPLPQVRRIDNRFFIDTGAGDGERLTVRNVASLVKEYRDFRSFL